MGFDVDDAVAVTLALSLEAHGLVENILMVHDTGCEMGVGGISALAHWYNRDDISLGAWKGEFGKGCGNQNQYLSTIIHDHPGPITHYDQVPVATDAYRKALAASPDNSVNIASIGLPTNLADLLDTQADQYSNLTGRDLISKKVHTIVFMDGGYNFGCTAGLVDKDPKDCYGKAKKALQMPENVRLISSLKGQNPDIYTGDEVWNLHPASSPLRDALGHWCCSPNGKNGRDTGRLSWDPITTVIAAVGVDAFDMKETHPGGTWSADDNGNEHNIGGGANNAATDFQDGSSPSKIKDYINQYVNYIPGQKPPAPPPPVAGCKVKTTPEAGAGPAMSGYGGGDYKMAWDGNTRTFYDYSKADGGWTQASMASDAPVTGIRWYPRENFLSRHVGGRFVGVASNNEEVGLATIEVAKDGWNILNVTAGSDKFHSVKYYAPNGGYGNVAEIEVYVPCPPTEVTSINWMGFHKNSAFASVAV
jgi:hypothetical protein